MADLVLLHRLRDGLRPQDAKTELGVDPSSVRHRIRKLSKLFSKALNENVDLVAPPIPGSPLELSGSGKIVAQWATDHLLLFERQVHQRSSLRTRVIRIAAVHMLLGHAAYLADRLREDSQDAEVIIIPIHSRHVNRRIASSLAKCDCFLAPVLALDGKLLDVPHGFTFEKAGEEHVEALMNQPLWDLRKWDRVSASDIEEHIAFLPGPGLMTAWMKYALGGARVNRLGKRRVIRDSLNQIAVLRTQLRPGLMLATGSMAKWAEDDCKPLSYAPQLESRKLCRVELAPDLRELHVFTGLMYREQEVASSPLLQRLRLEFRKKWSRRECGEIAGGSKMNG